MAAKPRITIVGPGNLGSALAGSLKDAGFVIDVVMARSDHSLRKAKALARKVGARATLDWTKSRADLMWLCVPDSEIAGAAKTLARSGNWKGRIVFHSSGALTSDELQPLRLAGAAVASVHPLMTFVRGSRPTLAGVSFAVEGDSMAVRLARRIVRELGGQAYLIRKKDKVAYHTWGMFASPLLNTLLATSERVATMAGVKRTAARRRMMPILLQTLANYAMFGAPGAFSGPIIRGDVETIRRHLRVLDREPVAREVYTALVRAAIEYLPAKNRNALKRTVGRRR